MRMLGDRGDPERLLERHRYQPVLPPLELPEEEQVTETERHLRLRLLLWESLTLAIGERATVGSDQFVYWDPTDQGQRVAPDVFVRLAVVVRPLRVLATWEHGVPDVVVEIVSDSDRPERAWQGKFSRYQQLAIREVVRFDPDAAVRDRLRLWDRVDGRLLERATSERAERSEVLELWWVVVADERGEPTLRLSRDPRCRDLLLTPREAAERARQVADQARQVAERGRDEERRAREAAEQRVRELEQELQRRGG